MFGSTMFRVFVWAVFDFKEKQEEEHHAEGEKNAHSVDFDISISRSHPRNNVHVKRFHRPTKKKRVPAK